MYDEIFSLLWRLGERMPKEIYEFRVAFLTSEYFDFARPKPEINKHCKHKESFVCSCNLSLNIPVT